MDPLAYGAQPICPSCGVTMHPEDGADECRECGHRIPWDEGERPADPEGIIDF